MGTKKVSKMQAILDKAQEDFDAGRGRESFMDLIEAIKLLSRAQQQIFDRVEHIGSRNPFIGGCDDLNI